MALSNPYSNYRDTQIKTASPMTLILLLYEGAVKEIVKGAEHLQDESKYLEASQHLLKAMNIVTELQGILNPSQSPELAQGLSDTYKLVLMMIGDGLKNREIEPLGKAAEMLTSLMSAWREAADKAAQQAV